MIRNILLFYLIKKI